MRDAVIVGAVRSPVGKRNGALSALHPVDLSAQVLQALVEKTSVDADVIDDVIWGCVGQVGEQAGDIARSAVLGAGWPVSIPGVTVDRQCGSSQQAVHFAAAGLIAGHYDAVVAGGVESMSLIPMGSAAGGRDTMGERYFARIGVRPHQGLGAEMIAKQWGISREDADLFGLESHQKAAAAADRGYFEEEITPVQVGETTVTVDEGIRRTTSLAALGSLTPAFDPEGIVTAGNASQISDGSAAVLMMTSERARELGVTPIARIHTATVVGSEPVVMLTGPIPATQKVLTRSGLSVDQIGTFEVNEAFASVPLAWMKELGVSRDLVNPDGGAIALGHPLGGSGARLMTTMLNRMRRESIRYGLQTMCEGGGQANATIVELCDV